MRQRCLWPLQLGFRWPLFRLPLHLSAQKSSAPSIKSRDKPRVSTIKLALLSTAILLSPADPLVAQSTNVRLLSSSGPQRASPHSRCEVLESATPSHHSLAACTKFLLHEMAGDDLVAYFGFTPRISIIENPGPIALSRPHYSLTLSTGITKVARTRDELAFVIAHEVGHLQLRHPEERSLSGQHALSGSQNGARLEAELLADRFAYVLSSRAGFDPDAGSTVLRRFKVLEEEHRLSEGSLYPGLLERIEQLKGMHRTDPDHSRLIQLSN